MKLSQMGPCPQSYAIFPTVTLCQSWYLRSYEFNVTHTTILWLRHHYCLFTDAETQAPGGPVVSPRSSSWLSQRGMVFESGLKETQSSTKLWLLLKKKKDVSVRYEQISVLTSCVISIPYFSFSRHLHWVFNSGPTCTIVWEAFQSCPKPCPTPGTWWGTQCHQ